MNNVSFLIDGRPTAAQHGGSYERINPLKGLSVTKAEAARSADVESAVAAAARAFPKWASTGPGRRRELLLKAAETLMAYRGKFVECMIAETGATEAWAGFNVAYGAS